MMRSSMTVTDSKQKHKIGLRNGYSKIMLPLGVSLFLS